MIITTWRINQGKNSNYSQIVGHGRKFCVSGFRQTQEYRICNVHDRGSAHAVVGEEELQLAEYQIPILISGMPMLHNPLRHQIEFSPQKIIVGKTALFLVICRNAGLGPQWCWSCIWFSGRYSKKALRISQLSSQLLTQEGYCLGQASAKRRRFSLRFVQDNSGIDFLQVGNDLLDVF